MFLNALSIPAKWYLIKIFVDIFSNVKKLAGYFMDVLEEKQEKVMENLQVNDSKSLIFPMVNLSSPPLSPNIICQTAVENVHRALLVFLPCVP